MFVLRCVLRLKGLSGHPAGGNRASHACTNSAILLLLAQQPVVPQRKPTHRLLRLLQHHHHALYCRFPSRPMVSTTTCRHLAHQLSLHLAVHVDIDAYLLFLPHLPARLTQ